MGSVPEPIRVLVRSAVASIKDIANQLQYRKSTLSKASYEAKVSPQLLSGVIEQSVSLKRLEYANIGRKISIDYHLDTLDAFAWVEKTTLITLLSNLVNNSIRALSGSNGWVKVDLYRDGSNAVITVSDNGDGIPPKTLELLKQEKFHTNYAGGSGQGLKHAFEAIKNWKGSISLDSLKGSGTKVTLRMPLSEPPLWFATALRLTPYSEVVVVDDDPSVHDIWDQRLTHGHPLLKLSIRHFYKANDLKDQFKTLQSTSLFLIDYEFVDQAVSGLDLIESLQIERKSLLVTSRWDDSQIIDRCLERGIQIVPKNLAGWIPVEGDPLSHSAPDCILIDDNFIVRRTWETHGRSLGIYVQTFLSYAHFCAFKPVFDLKTPIYVDFHLKDETGLQVTKSLSEMGFKHLNIVTGDLAEDLPAMPWVEKVFLSKSPPFLA